MCQIKESKEFKEKRITELEEILWNAENGQLYTFEEAWKNNFEIYARRMENKKKG